MASEICSSPLLLLLFLPPPPAPGPRVLGSIWGPVGRAFGDIFVFFWVSEFWSDFGAKSGSILAGPAAGAHGALEIES